MKKHAPESAGFVLLTPLPSATTVSNTAGPFMVPTKAIRRRGRISPGLYPAVSDQSLYLLLQRCHLERLKIREKFCQIVEERNQVFIPLFGDGVLIVTFNRFKRSNIRPLTKSGMNVTCSLISEATSPR
jgi:hypothetical protein